MARSRNRSRLPRTERFSEAAIRQQQAAWLLYIAEGHLANLTRVRETNSFLMFADEVAMLDNMISTQAAVALRIRKQLFGAE